MLIFIWNYEFMFSKYKFVAASSLIVWLLDVTNRITEEKWIKGNLISILGCRVATIGETAPLSGSNWTPPIQMKYFEM